MHYSGNALAICIASLAGADGAHRGGDVLIQW